MAKKNTIDEVASGLGRGVTFLQESISGGVQGILQAVFGTLEQGTLALFRKLFRSIGLFFFAVLGGVFLLIGTARVLDTVYQLPGIGEIVVGTLIFAGILILYMIEHTRQSQ